MVSMEERAEYAFCLQASGSQQFLFALLRQPSFFKAEGLEKLLEEWANIKRSPEYKAATKTANSARSSKPSSPGGHAAESEAGTQRSWRSHRARARRAGEGLPGMAELLSVRCPGSSGALEHVVPLRRVEK